MHTCNTLDDGQVLAPVVPGLVTVHHRDGQPEHQVYWGLDGGVHLGGDVGLLPLLGVNGIEAGDQELHVGGDRGAVAALGDQLDLRRVARHRGDFRCKEVSVSIIILL